MPNYYWRPRARAKAHYQVYAAATIFLLLSVGAPNIIERSVYGEWAGKPGNWLTEGFKLLGILTSVFLFWSATRKLGYVRLNWLLPLAAAGFLLGSISWSFDPSKTLTQGTAYFFVTLGAVGLAEMLEGNDLMDLTASICGLCAVVSLLLHVTIPESGDFRGIFSQKNVLGEVMAAGVLAGLHCARRARRIRVWYMFIVFLCVGVALMSRSSTSAVTVALFVLGDTFVRLYFRGGVPRMAGIWLVIASAPAFLLASMNVDFIFDVLGKDETFTGRTDIWRYVIDNIADRPFFGWGFWGFWTPFNPHAAEIFDALRWITPNSHNGLLEILLQVGFVGAILFLFLWVRYFAVAIRCMIGPAREFGTSSVFALLGILVIGVTEVVLLEVDQLWTSMFFAIGLTCEKELRLARNFGASKSALLEDSIGRSS